MVHAAARSLAVVRDAVRAAATLVFDAALPPLCPVCGDLLADPGALCPACWGRVSFITRPYCERLGIPFAVDAGPGQLSPRAIADPPAFRKARAAVRYDDVARALVHALKYGDRLEVAPMMGAWMAQAGRELLAEADALVPVPLHWRRLWARRFNQSALLADAVAAASGIPVLRRVLQRTRATAQQVGLRRAERADNVQSAFAVAAEQRGEIRGRHVILVDDVMTSGATIEACTRTLLRAGATTVDVLVFACVVDATGL